MTKRSPRKTFWQRIHLLVLTILSARFLLSKQVRVGITFCTAVLTLLPLSYFCFVNFTEQYEVGVRLNVLTQETSLQENSGIHFTAPWILVSVVDTRPQRVCITSDSRAYNCKLVQFDATQFREFVAVEGWRYWWWANRISFNFGYREEYRGMRDILRGHAYGTKRYSFLKILD